MIVEINKILITFKMKEKLFKSGLCVLLLVFVWACDDYNRTGVEESVYVNKSSLALFVGEQIQLTASPTASATYIWTSEDPTVAKVTNGLVEAVGEGVTNIVASDGIAQKKVAVTVSTKILLTGIKMSADRLEMSPNDNTSILVTLIPDNANDVPGNTSWTSENGSVAVVDAGGKITAIAQGVTNIVYRMGNIVKTIVVDVSTTRPFKGPHVLSTTASCIINTVDFDLGGEGNAFHDADSGDNSGQGGNYRRQGDDTQSDAVDIEGFGQNVGWTGSGEWLLYSVEVQNEGEYLVDVQTSVPGTGSFHLEVDGVNVTKTVDVPNTDGWGNFEWNPSPGIVINLTAGKHKIKYYFEGGHNIRALRFTSMTAQQNNIISYLDVQLGGWDSNFGSALDADTGSIYGSSQLGDVGSIIDIFFDHAELASRDLDAIDFYPESYNGARFPETGTKFATTNISSSGFNGITNDELFSPTLGMVSSINIKEGDVIFFQTKSGRKGLLRVKSLTDPTGDLTVDLKVQK